MRQAETDERWWDWPAAIFLILAFFFGAARFQTTNWTEHLGRIPILVLIAASLGMLIGYSRFRLGVVIILGCGYSLIIPAWVLTSLVRSESWLERVLSLGGRLGAALKQLTANQAVTDPFLFLTTMYALFWLAALFSGYHLMRHGKPWVGIAVVGITLLVVEYSYDMYAVEDPGSAYSVFFFICALLLLARIFFLKARSDWQRRGFLVENEVGFDLGRVTVIVGLILVIAAWSSPRVVRTLTPGSTENLQLTAGIQRFRERFDKVVSSLRSQSPITVQSLGDTLGLGRGSNLSEDLVFYAKPAGGKLNTYRYYWGGRYYETYRNDQWEAVETQVLRLGPPTGPLEYPEDGRTEVNVEFSTRISFLRTLHFPGAVIDISRPVSAVWVEGGDNLTDVTALIMDPPLRSGEIYKVTALVSTPTKKMLREAAFTALSENMSERYLQLPVRFPERIRNLAQEITRDLENPYDRVEAITEYLRDEQNIRYEPTVPEIPENVDPIEWFLFTHRAGFCNYSATAEVLMLRSIGIPARMAVGYAAGVWNEEEKRYDVRSMDYHAWPEVYFPGLGWVPFEPTGSQVPLEYPDGTVVDTGADPEPTPIATPFIPNSAGGREFADEEELTRLRSSQQRQLVLALTGIGLGLLVAGGLAYLIVRFLGKPLQEKTPLAIMVEDILTRRGWRVPGWVRNWARLARRTPMEKLFAAVGEMLRAWGKSPTPDLTPAEQVSRLTEVVPEITHHATVLLEEYHRSVYSPFGGDFRRARRAAEDVRALGYRAWMNRNAKQRD
jgi:transglutaminase-like putative cysteine protease